METHDTMNKPEQLSFFSDKVMAQLHDKVVLQLGPLSELQPRDPEEYFWELCESILGQQLSEKVAPQIVARVKNVLKNQLEPTVVLATEDQALRAAGVSFAKISYLKNVAQAWQSGTVRPDQLASFTDEEIIAQLTQIKGVGRWTVEMFLIFTLARPDVFSAGDYGLKRAILQAYSLPTDIKPAQLSELAGSWQPRRSLASRVLWKSLELL